MSELVAMSIRLTADQLNRLKELEKLDNIPLARRIRMAVDLHIRMFEQNYHVEPPAAAANPAPSRKNPAISYR